MTKAFTLIEILIVIAILAILISAVVFIINPAERLASARNTRRATDLNTMMLSISQNVADNKGVFVCESGMIPTTTPARMASSSLITGTTTYDIAPCLIPVYTDTLRIDPNATGTYYTATTDYDTGYYITQNASTSRITLTAPFSELGATTSLSN